MQLLTDFLIQSGNGTDIDQIKACFFEDQAKKLKHQQAIEDSKAEIINVCNKKSQSVLSFVFENCIKLDVDQKMSSYHKKMICWSILLAWQQLETELNPIIFIK